MCLSNTTTNLSTFYLFYIVSLYTLFYSYLYYLFFNQQIYIFFFFFFQAEDGIRDYKVTGVQTCALPISAGQGGPEFAVRLRDCGQPLGRELEHEALRVAAHAARLLDWHQQVRRRQVALKLAVEIAWKHLPHVDVRVGKKLQRRGCDVVADRPLDVLVPARFHRFCFLR